MSGKMQSTPQFLRSFYPVSYTHLDVYKRQAVEIIHISGISMVSPIPQNRAVRITFVTFLLFI